MVACPRCKGEGYFVLVFKARSIGITTLTKSQMGEKVKCPDCNGTGSKG